MATPIRFITGTGLLVLSLCTFAEEDPKVLEPVEVTGYHLKRMDIEGPSPVIVFNREDLEQAGINTLEEFARYLPINSPEPVLRFDTVGAAVFDLRGIGIDTTLTLVNGLRIAPYAQSAETYIDVNSIPVSAIERIEILKDGASAIYGADAIAGVVNIILRDGWDGIEVNAGYGTSEHGDGQEMMADVVAGKDTGRGSIMFSLSWYKRRPQAMRDRDWSSDADFSDEGGPNRRHPYSSPPGFGIYAWDYTVADPACGTDPLISSVGAGPYGPEYGYGCRFNFVQYQDLYPGFERLGASLSGRYEVSANLSLFGDLLYSNIDAEANQAPIAIGNSSAEESLWGDPFVPADHPNNPFGYEGEVYSRPLDAGNRVHINDSNAWRAVLGLEGAWGDWDWRLSGLASQNRVEKTFRNLWFSSRYQAALMGLGGPGGDQWYNPFGYQPHNDPALVGWLSTDAKQRDKSKEGSIDLLFSRLFGSLPDGPAGIAIGLQYREQKLKQWADDNLLSGDLAHSHEPVDADRDIGSAYIEFSLPCITRWKPNWRCATSTIPILVPPPTPRSPCAGSLYPH